MLILKIILIVIVIFLLFLLIFMAYRIYKKKHLEKTLKDVHDLQREGRTDDAIHILEREVNMKYDETKFLALINIILATGDYDKALKFFENNDKRGNKSFNTEMMWAYTEFLNGDNDKAIKRYEKLMNEYPENKHIIQFNLASVYTESKKDLSKAESIYLELLKGNKIKQKYNLYLNLGFVQMELKKYEQAIINEKIALEQIPKDDNFHGLFALAHYIIGMALLGMGQKKEGKNELNIAKEYSNNETFIKKINSILNNIDNNNS